MEDMSPSRTLDKFLVRMPAGMRELLRISAERSNRSMNAEIVNRLEESLTGVKVITADEAARHAQKALEDQETALRNAVACAIRDAAASGRRTTAIATLEMEHSVVAKVVAAIEKLGYAATVTDSEIQLKF